jgi:hypothetical protein
LPAGDVAEDLAGRRGDGPPVANQAAHQRRSPMARLLVYNTTIVFLETIYLG